MRVMAFALTSCLIGAYMPELAHASETLSAQSILKRATAQLALPPRTVAVELQMRGIRYSPEQARDPATAVAEIGAQQSVLWANDGHYRLKTDTHYPGNIEFRFLTIGSRDGEATVDPMHWREGIEILRDPADQARSDGADLLLLSPALLLNDAMAHETVANSGADGVTVTYDDDAKRAVKLTIEPVRAQVVAAEVDKDRYTYADYRVQEKLSQPSHVQRFRNGQRIADWTAVSARPLTTIPPAAFQLPDGYVEKQSRGALRATDLGHGAWRVDGTPSGYHTGFVVGERSIAVFDAPVGVEEARQVKALIQRAAPGKPIAYVVVSHVHGDHVAGLPVYVGDGVQVLAGARAGIALRRQFGDKVDLHLQEITRARELDLGHTKVVVYPLTSTHASTMLVGYAPQARTLFQGDLFYLPEVGPIPPAFEGGKELAGLIAQQKLAVDHIVGVHGRSGDAGDLAESIRLQYPGNRSGTL
ncbi:metallo-beta-lactamase superfamily protein [Luteibacter rhizovicinus]|uniref:Metallo-beta-lactamase superfamily protein n=1 Tax=Luteibacter rhizovicinus TaxID=242606 RepID=A0A4R3YV24_9GAMM|nr:MBL fold metallo-hydrolase [Luteibacter rhizovicinus]TCV96420.1 metallo-beta-lactamase superfamily protein [Luteibacter rhizovicinus]